MGAGPGAIRTQNAAIPIQFRDLQMTMRTILEYDPDVLVRRYSYDALAMRAFDLANVFHCSPSVGVKWSSFTRQHPCPYPRASAWEWPPGPR